MPVLDWIGKQAVVNHDKEVPYRLLRCEEELSVGDATSGNLLVEGDNLLALKALLPYYAGQVKCVYIDPPYNTGNEDWVYNDSVNSPEMRAWLGRAVGGESEDLSRHDKWLCMMYPRLRLLSQFLREDGSIWVSMDDSEEASLRLVMDEVFGRRNYVGTIVWQKRYSRENREAIGDVHEYIMVYARSPEAFKSVRNRVPADEAQCKVYKNPNGDPGGRWRGVPMTAQGFRPNQMYSITTPAGVVHAPPEGRCWSMIESEYLRLRAEDRIYFGKNGKSQPSVIRYLSEVDGFVPWSWWPHGEVGHTDEARKEIRELLGTQTAFETPKPVRLIRRILQIATNPGDLVLDSFAGSGTTGHAVLDLNGEGGADRRFILVELEEQIAQTVTRERLRRVVEGYTSAKPNGGSATVEGLGRGFRYYRLGAELFDAAGRINPDVSFEDLARHIYFVATGEPLTGEVDAHCTLIGTHGATAYYLLYNGVLRDKSPRGGNVLTSDVLSALPPYEGPRVVYGVGCRLGADRLLRESVTFRQIPYQIRVD